MAAEKIDGIVISFKNYAENDSLIKMISPGIGINSYIARRSRNPKNKLSAIRQLFTYGTFSGKKPKKNGLGYINSIEDSSIFKNISLDIIKNAYASHIAELLDKAFEDGQQIDNWYRSFLIGLKKIDQGIDPQIIANIFEIQLLGVFGVQPNLSYDPIDHTAGGEFDFSEKFNGILSKKHFGLDPRRLHADPRAIYYLMMLSQIDISRIGSVRISSNIKRSLQRVINLIYDRQIGLKTHSRSFLEEMDSIKIDIRFKKKQP